MKYTVKTRNWNCKKVPFKLLNLTKLFGVERGDIYNDGDGKFYLETTNA